jgi:hypothetical protein
MPTQDAIDPGYQELLEEYAELVAVAADTPSPYLDLRLADLREVLEASDLLHFA